jgi:hypothetical protein
MLCHKNAGIFRRTDKFVFKARRLRAAIGLEPYEKKLLGITAMTTLLGKKRFEDTLSGYIAKPKGKPVLYRKRTSGKQSIRRRTISPSVSPTRVNMKIKGE